MEKILDPKKIEEKSFEIIEGLLPVLNISIEQKAVIKRVIHATTDVNYATNLLFHSKAIESGLKAIREGKNIFVDVNMVKSGINEKTLKKFGGKVVCSINDIDVAEEASKLGISKASYAIKKHGKSLDNSIIAIGNAPTALFEICDMIRKNEVTPALVIGVPVGFVGASESKEELSLSLTPFITNQGKKGGSSVAVAIVNALLKLA